MPRNPMNKNELECRIHKLKTSLYDRESENKNEDFHEGAHNAYNEVLNILQEWRT